MHGLGFKALASVNAIAWAIALCANAALADPLPARPSSQTSTAQQSFDALIAKAKTAMMGDPKVALSFASQSETIAGATPDPSQSVATSLWLQAEALTRINQPEKAQPLVERGLKLAALDRKETKLDGDLNMALARIANAKGDPELALRSYQRAYNIFVAAGEARAQSIALQGLGAIYGDARDYARAHEYYDRAAKAFSGDPILDLSAANNLGNALRQMGRYKEALKDFERALAISATTDSPLLDARILTNIAAVQALDNNLPAAEAAANKALRLLLKDDSDGWSGFVWGIKAQIEFKRNRLDAAVQDLTKAFRGVDPKTSTAPYRDIHEIAYKIYRATGDTVSALNQLEAFKRLDDEASLVSASTNLALMGARFDFATQQLEISRLRSERLQRDVSLARAEANQQWMTMIASLLIAVLTVGWMYWGYRSATRHRNEIKGTNAKLEQSLHELHDEVARRKDTETALRAAKDLAEQANVSKSQFLANMSHELRTPLNAIIGFSELMANEVLGAMGVPAYRGYAQDIHESGTHLLAILSDILDMARVDAGKLRLAEANTELNQAIAEAIHMCTADPLAKGKTVSFARREPGLLLRCDARLLRQMVINLVSNSMKYGKDEGHIDVVVDLAADGATIAVVDDGIGIPADKFETIMEPFGQVENSYARARGGIGLGLPLVKSLIELHGGSMSIESELGKGTKVTLRFPHERVVGLARAA